MSMVPNTQQQNRGRKNEEESDAFMRLVWIPKFPQLLHHLLIRLAGQRNSRMY